MLNRAFEALKTLPAVDRDRIAWEIIERIEDKTEWDSLIASPEAQDWLAEEARKALKEYGKISKKISMTFISVMQDNLLRERAYWTQFDDLPDEMRQLAEKNYHLWKENPSHPGLRFKKIHHDLPIFSFRVGMRHRTVGVETDDGKVVWFWVGSFEIFEAFINPDKPRR